MKSFPIYLNYDLTEVPVGRVEIDEDQIPVDDFPDVVIAPTLMVDKDPEKCDRYRLKEFGMIQRTTLDTGPIENLGKRT